MSMYAANKSMVNTDIFTNCHFVVVCTSISVIYHNIQKIISGFSGGAFVMAAPAYIAEIAETK